MEVVIETPSNLPELRAVARPMSAVLLPLGRKTSPTRHPDALPPEKASSTFLSGSPRADDPTVLCIRLQPSPLFLPPHSAQNITAEIVRFLVFLDVLARTLNECR